MISLVMAEKFLPPFLFGIMVAGVSAAAMSTVDSQLLILTTSISHDMFGKKFGPEKELLLSRTFALIISSIALLFALSAKEFIYSLVFYAWGGLASSFGPSLILLLYWKRITK